ncbi:colanic acid biosynthesis protein WcaH [Halopseudomonas xinjiangensis]|uniref:Colanic acid biosynthesis protein WcaH n=1 Tax=Halopseudomonas xinjiangensis TaxID=487184 RepID=A0A1H1WDI4_9GAMM|nr:GDP-mannose mannosyl hydrolase [Halopseudomonas xinjiangensis]SDS95347.1 colanic acid biosynthesis protein WcaH [Halopseudomonas xinjiangensis]
MYLDKNTFRSVVAHAPLVSLDLVVRNAEGEILLGRRVNRPAQGDWFVPGGRIMKNERLDDAFARITEAELGQSFARSQARLLDLYEHFYEDSVFGPTPDTHYVVAGYLLDLPAGCSLSLPKSQHDGFRWWTVADMRSSTAVHENSRAYLAAVDR